MHTLVLPHSSTVDTMKLELAAKRLGYPVVRLYNHGIASVRTVEDPVVYGPLWFCRAVALEVRTSGKSIHLAEPPDTWLAKVPAKYLKRMVEAIKAAEVGCLSSEPRFYKPANDKVFHRSVYADPLYVPLNGVDPQSIVLISEVVHFEYEARLWVSRNRIQTGSFYIESADPDLEPRSYSEAVSFAEEYLAEYPQSEALTLDVGYITDRGWAIIEVNQAWASGIYTDADPVKILETITASQYPTTSWILSQVEGP